MWVYQRIGDYPDDVYTVGFFNPNGEWFFEGHYSTREEAALRVHFLNGGTLYVPKSPSSVR